MGKAGKTTAETSQKIGVGTGVASEIITNRSSKKDDKKP